MCLSKTFTPGTLSASVVPFQLVLGESFCSGLLTVGNITLRHTLLVVFWGLSLCPLYFLLTLCLKMWPSRKKWVQVHPKKEYWRHWDISLVRLLQSSHTLRLVLPQTLHLEPLGFLVAQRRGFQPGALTWSLLGLEATHPGEDYIMFKLLKTWACGNPDCSPVALLGLCFS